MKANKGLPKKLKCPFCKTNNGTLYDYPHIRVICIRCGAQGPERELTGSGKFFGSIDEALKAWDYAS
jgi:ribosomal protein S27E